MLKQPAAFCVTGSDVTSCGVFVGSVSDSEEEENFLFQRVSNYHINETEADLWFLADSPPSSSEAAVVEKAQTGCVIVDEGWSWENKDEIFGF